MDCLHCHLPHCGNNVFMTYYRFSLFFISFVLADVLRYRTVRVLLIALTVSRFQLFYRVE